MRLLDRGPHTVTVHPYVEKRTDLGRDYSYGDPVTVERVAIQPVSVGEGEDQSSASGTYTVIGSGMWPGTSRSRVTVVTGPHPGEYDQQGPAKHHGMSPRTSHYVVRITLRSEA